MPKGKSLHNPPFHKRGVMELLSGQEALLAEAEVLIPFHNQMIMDQDV
jgi:hypothetical protein